MEDRKDDQDYMLGIWRNWGLKGLREKGHKGSKNASLIKLGKKLKSKSSQGTIRGYLLDIRNSHGDEGASEDNKTNDVEDRKIS